MQIIEDRRTKTLQNTGSFGVLVLKNFVVTDKNVGFHVENIARFISKKVESARMNGLVLGMSGGIDCSVVARLVMEANIPLKLVLMPDGKNSPKSISDSMLLIDKFKMNYEIIDISNICKNIESVGEFNRSSLINIRPRVRMTILYAIAQSNNSLVIGTGNLDERLMGYFTKWGDGGYDLNPLGLLTKGEVRTLARYLDVPCEIITKAPSADLFDGQTDEADLGCSYEVLDEYILKGTSKDLKTDAFIKAKIESAAHKLKPSDIYDGS